MNYNKINYIVGYIIFICATLVYLFTMPPTISLWDSGEFAASAYTLSIPHTPGASLWLLLGKLATLLPFGSNPAVKLNIFSSISSGFTIMFLYLTIVIVIKNFREDIKDNWDASIIYGSAIIGALSLGFCDSFWSITTQSGFNAFQTLLISLCTWLLFKWGEKSDISGNERVLLLLGFIFGLGQGGNLSLLLLVGGLLYYFKKYEFSRKTFLIAFFITFIGFIIINPVLMNWYPLWLGGNIKLFKINNSSIIKALAVLLIPITIIGIIILVQRGKKNLAIGLTVFILILFGYSINTVIIFRSQMDNLNLSQENSNNFSTYINSRQNYNAPITEVPHIWPRRYSHEADYSKTWTNFSGDWDFLWRYQINHLFTRYLGWQYIGRSSYEQDKGIDWKKFYGIPLMFGLFGLFYHFKKNWKQAIVFLWMFLLMGILTVFYLNLQDPQPREKDYIFTGAYWVFSLWIGIGVTGLLEIISINLKSMKIIKFSLALVLIFCFIFIPVKMFAINSYYNNQAKNYIPFDYAYNMLQSIEKDGILLTDGDNNVYPLMYLQSIGYRQDVSVINISMLNDRTFIKKLKNSTANGNLKVPINFSDDQIDLLQPLQWGEFKQVSIPVTKDAFPDSLLSFYDFPDKLTWKMPSTIYSGDSTKAVGIRELMTLEIIKSNNWKRPIYFSSSIPDNDCLGLNDYLISEGLAKKLVPYRDNSGIQNRVDEKTYNNLMSSQETFSKTPASGFIFRNLREKSFFTDQVTNEIIQNYRSQYLTLAFAFLGEDSLKVGEILDKMEFNLPRNVIPIDYRIEHDIAMLYAKIGEIQKFEELSKDVEVRAIQELQNNPNDIQTVWNPYKLLIDIYETRKDYKNELDILLKLNRVAPGIPEVKSKIDSLSIKSGDTKN